MLTLARKEQQARVGGYTLENLEGPKMNELFEDGVHGLSIRPEILANLRVQEFVGQNEGQFTISIEQAKTSFNEQQIDVPFTR